MLAIATFLPITYCLSFAGIVLFGLLTSWEPPQNFLVALVLAHFACICLIIGLFVIYARHLHNNQRIPAEQKPLWLAILFIANAIAMPFYWYTYVYRLSEQQPA